MFFDISHNTKGYKNYQSASKCTSEICRKCKKKKKTKEAVRTKKRIKNKDYLARYAHAQKLKT